MKKQNKNYLNKLLGKNISKKTIWLSLLIVACAYMYVFAADILLIITNQTAIAPGSSNSVIITSSGFGVDPDNKKTLYYNLWDNSSAIWNYFAGYYHDTVLGFFILNWSPLSSNNVKITGGTNLCSSGYGYKLWGYAYSKTVGFINFAYNSSIYVYYCVSDGKLHGFAYNKYSWFQNFEGIAFNLFPTISNTSTTNSNWLFVNDVTKLTTPTAYTWANSNTKSGVIWGDNASLDDTQEQQFYIIK